MILEPPGDDSGAPPGNDSDDPRENSGAPRDKSGASRPELSVCGPMSLRASEPPSGLGGMREA